MSNFDVRFPYDAVDPVPQTVYYAPDTLTVNDGTDNGDPVANAQVMLDGNVVDVTEVAGTPGFDVEFGWNDVLAAPSHFLTRSFYNGGNTEQVEVQIYNYSTSSWDALHTFPDALGYVTYDIPIPKNIVGDYWNRGAMKVRFYHASGGSASNDIYIDYVAFVFYGGRP